MKERLIGATVLVGLAVWLIPWVLDGPLPDTDLESAQVLAAERLPPLRTQTLRLDNPEDASVQAGEPDIHGRPITPGSQTSAVVIAESGEGSSGASGGLAARVPDETSTEASSRHPGSGWLIQVGSFGDEENASRQADRVAALGYTAKLYTHSSGGRVMYRVRVGPELSREGADDIALSLTAHGFVAQVVSSD